MKSIRDAYNGFRVRLAKWLLGNLGLVYNVDIRSRLALKTGPDSNRATRVWICDCYISPELEEDAIYFMN